ncbi:uncharacterized protein F4822DRAFT_439437 [Hypoxylon trugodes]|uniref:uncharacterized protein n=1 Tax=Hypoxylon trugodes TaxID=326681 RepID=UPI00219F6377|nr:uncharacterized protein F4822DRAFT_439437 [Hypoxylon trugodes]KAI1393351.1 hypothetical protein F4822DRAFT_439437 [Hypoxylon trugodes]
MSSLIHRSLEYQSSYTGVGISHSARLILSSTDEDDPNINMFFEHQSSSQGYVSGLSLMVYFLKEIHRKLLLPIHARYKSLDHGNFHLLALSPNHKPNEIVQSTIVNTCSPCSYGDTNLIETGLQCGHLLSSSLMASIDVPRRPLGYINIEHNRMLVFYTGLEELEYDFAALKQQEIMPFVEALKLPIQNEISIQDCIKLGIILVKSMLKYNSTPWWPQDWTLEQVFIFRGEEFDLSSTLDTIHLFTELRAIRVTEEGGKPFLTNPGDGTNF